VLAPVQRIRAVVPLRWVTVDPDGSDACIVSTRGPWSQSFLVHMALLGEPIEILDPPELHQAARGVVQRLASAASADPTLGSPT